MHYLPITDISVLNRFIVNIIYMIQPGSDDESGYKRKAIKPLLYACNIIYSPLSSLCRAVKVCIAVAALSVTTPTEAS